MIRVLVIEPAGNLWGSERALLDLLDGLKDIEIAVCCPPNRPLQPELERRKIAVFPYYIYELHKTARWRRLQAAIGVLRACLRWQPDLLYLNQSGAYRTALPAAGFLGLPLIAHVRIFEDVDYLARQAPSLSRLRGLIAISHAIEDAIYCAPELRAIPIHMLYDAYTLRASASPAPVRENVLACVGRIVPVKGQDILLNALSLLTAQGRAPQCLMVGDGDADYVAHLKGLAPASVMWMGQVNDVTSLLRRCRVNICPSRAEPLGRVIFEAWDGGALPVTCAQNGGAAEIICASHGGLLYSEHTAQSLADAITRAFTLTGLERDEIVRKGRDWLMANCDPIRYGRAVSDIIKSVVLGAEI